MPTQLFLLSLALHDTTPGLLSPVLRHLNQETYNILQHSDKMNNLAILQKKGDQFLCEEKFEFTGRR